MRRLERTCKPGFVPAASQLRGVTISLGPNGYRGLEQPTRKRVRDGPPRDVPEGTNFFLLGLAPGGVCRARPVTRPAGELLPHRFTLTAGEIPDGGLLSVALSLTSRSVGVTHHPALRSPDFPPAAGLATRRRRSPGPLQSLCCH